MALVADWEPGGVLYGASSFMEVLDEWPATSPEKVGRGRTTCKPRLQVSCMYFGPIKLQLQNTNSKSKNFKMAI